MGKRMSGNARLLEGDLEKRIYHYFPHPKILVLVMFYFFLWTPIFYLFINNVQII